MTDDHTQIINMAKDIEYIKSEISEIKQLIKDHITDEDRRFQVFADTKAGVWVEKAIYWSAACIIAAAFGLIWAVVTKKILI
jgi:hypothetical protein